MERVLVGVDGSQAAREALRWAFHEARCREAALQVVLVAAPAYLYGSEAPYWADRDEIIEEARSQLDATFEDVIDDDAGVDIERRIEAGDPRRVLRELSAEADLLVVGSRGHGEISGVLLGSVGQYLVTHARCPVTVVRPKQ